MLHAVDFEFVENNPFLSYQAYDPQTDRVPFKPINLHKWLAAYGLYSTKLLELIVRQRLALKSLGTYVNMGSTYEEFAQRLTKIERDRYNTPFILGHHENKVRVILDSVVIGVTKGLIEAERGCPSKWYPTLRDILRLVNDKIRNYPNLVHEFKMGHSNKEFRLNFGVPGGPTLGQLHFRDYHKLMGLLELMEKGIIIAEERRHEFRG